MWHSYLVLFIHSFECFIFPIHEKTVCTPLSIQFVYCILGIHMLKKRTAMPATWVLCKNQSGPSIDFGEELLPCPSIGPKLFWTSLNCLVQVQNRFSMLNRSENVFPLLNFTFLITYVQIEHLFWTCPKQFGRVQNFFGLVEGQGQIILHYLGYSFMSLFVMNLITNVVGMS